MRTKTPNLRKLVRVKRFILDLGGGLRHLADSCRDPLLRPRLRRRLADGPITHVPCLVPFRRLEFLERGHVSACCPAYTHVPFVGNINQSTIEEIWNSPPMQRIRSRLLLGETASVCRPSCPFLRRQPLAIQDLPEETEDDRRFKADLAAGRTALSVPPNYFVLSNWGRCNLRCKMCGSWSEEPLPPHVTKTYENLQRFFDHPVTLMLTGNGDPLARKDTRDLLAGLSRHPNPNISVEILTNGLLWTEETWAQIRNCRFTVINVSIDAARPRTYEKIRRGAKWKTLQRALGVIRRARDEGAFGYVVINMTVMRSNYREIPEFIRMARSYGFYASFEPIRGRWEDENIFDPVDRAALDELDQILADPALYGLDVNLAALRAVCRKA